MSHQPEATVKVIPYYRVSTARQGKSGLGLEAQRTAVEQWAVANHAEIIPVPPYVEVESGKNSDRPKLAAALAHAKASRATLVVAKLDRLSRNVAFLSALMESKIPFVCVDNPTATPLTIHILAAVAEDEAKRISERTRSALAAYKARGGKLGGSLPQCRNLTPTGRIKGSQAGVIARQRQTSEAYQHLSPLIVELRTTGQTLQQIAERLNADGYVTRTGKAWNRVQVMRLLPKPCDSHQD
jgi:DNA invertase Pin-like site-specific DNA recombinase